MGAELSKPRVFVGPVEIAGYYSGLAAALRDAGYAVDSVDLSRHQFRYARGPRPSWAVRAATRTTAGSLHSQARSPRGIAWRTLDVTARLWLIAWAIRRFDVFVFGFGQTLLRHWDLPILRRAGKRLIFVFNGTDARPSYVDGADMALRLDRTIDDAIELARRKKARIRRIERYAHVIVSQPAFSHFFERPVVDFFRVGVPVTVHGATSAIPPRGGSIRMLHSPSDPEVKGSARIREVVEDLRARGHALELVELRGVPNDKVRDEILRADFVIDQLYSDAPMVGFATEAAVAGRPAIVGGYAWSALHEIYDRTTMPPVEECDPDHLADAILRLATDREHRLELGERARRFATVEWSPTAIADRYASLIRGEIRPEWLFDPSRLRYVRGVGMTETRARELVAGVIASGGRRALQLGDKPEVEQAFVDFAENG